MHMKTSALLLGCLIATPIATRAYAEEPGRPGASAQTQTQMGIPEKPLTDAELTQRLHDINQTQIAMGRLAQSNASSKDVKEFGNKLIEDHTKENRKLTDVAKKLNVTLTTAVPSESTTLTETLRSKTGTEFDQHFLITIQQAHDQAALLITSQVFTHPVAKELKDYAKKDLTMINEHRKKSIDLLEKMGDKITSPAS